MLFSPWFLQRARRKAIVHGVNWILECGQGRMIKLQEDTIWEMWEVKAWSHFTSLSHNSGVALKISPTTTTESVWICEDGWAEEKKERTFVKLLPGKKKSTSYFLHKIIIDVFNGYISYIFNDLWNHVSESVEAEIFHLWSQSPQFSMKVALLKGTQQSHHGSPDPAIILTGALSKRLGISPIDMGIIDAGNRLPSDYDASLFLKANKYK